MESADNCSDSLPSPSSTCTQLGIGSPIRIRDSASRPRRSLLSAHFSGDEAKIAKTESPLSADGLSKTEGPLSAEDGLSKSLPSPPISAFLDKQEEEALEPTTPPHTATFLAPPMAPRKILMHRPPRRGKHRPRKLLFDPSSAEERDEDDAYSSQHPAASSINGVLTSSHQAAAGSINGVLTSPHQAAARSVNGTLTPPHQSFNSFATSPTSTANPSRRIRMRDLR